MRAEERRRAILEHLRQSSRPVSAGFLAERFSVSRQAVVGDVALLRAAGEGLLRRVACRHDGLGMEAELNAMVDQGCSVLDVIVEHPVYGQLTGSLQLSSRYDVSLFLARCAESDARPLSDLTGGVHLHTLSCPGEDAFRRAREALGALGVLWEGEE